MQAAKVTERQARSFGEALYAIRIGEKWSYAELASKVGVSKNLIKEWENDEAIPDALRLKKLYGMLPPLKHATELLPKLVRETFQSRMYATGESGEDLWIPPSSPDNSSKESTPVLTASFGDALKDAMSEESLEVNDLGSTFQVTDATIVGWVENKHSPSEKQYKDLVELFPKLASAKPRENLTVNSEPRELPLAIVPSEESKETRSRTIVQVPAKTGTPGRSIQMASTAPQRPTPPLPPPISFAPPSPPPGYLPPAPPQQQMLASPQRPGPPPPLWQPNPYASSGPPGPPLGQSHRVRSNVEVAGVRHANARLAVKQAKTHIADIKAQLAEAERELSQRESEASAAQQDLDLAIDNAT